jgi:hypothetical protein
MDVVDHKIVIFFDSLFNIIYGSFIQLILCIIKLYRLLKMPYLPNISFYFILFLFN